MRKGVFLSILVMMIVPALPALGQRFTISGYVEDGSTGEKLIAASVYDTINGLGTTTNEYGFYSLTLDAGEVELSASFVGYGMFRNTLNLGDHKRINIVLDPNLELEEVTITTNRPRDVVESSEMSTARISVHEIKSLPVLLGEADILKTLQLLPGVQSGTEGTSGIYVRGGGPDQNLILLDGVPVYNADHLFGFFSVFNPDAISSIKLTKGGFPAHYGGRLSSVIDIRMKEGNMKEFSGAGSIGLISSKLMLEGPIVKDRTSFIITGRRTYIDILARPVIRAVNRATGDDVVAGYYFYDANLKINHKFSDRDRIYLSAYTGKDKTYALYEDAWAYGDSVYTDKGEFGLYWGNTTTVLRWNHVYGNKLFSNLSAFYSRYKFDVFEKYTSYVNDIKSEEYTFDYFSGIEDWGGILDLDYYPNPNHAIRFGGKYLYHTFSPGVTAFKATDETDSVDFTFGNKDIYANEFYLYAEDNMQIGSRIRANLGLHYSMFLVNGTRYHSLQPRFSMRLLATKDLSLKAAFTRMDQYIHLLTYSTIGLPTDLWLPSTRLIKPQLSYQAAFGGAYNFRDSWALTLEGFYKSMDNLIEYKEGASYFQVEVDWESKVDIGHGWAYGAELLARREQGRLTGWIGYTLSWSNRLFEEINQGDPFPYTYDRRHDVSLVMMFDINKRTNVSATWIYGTGKALTLGIARYAAHSDFIEYEGEEFYYSNWNELEYYKGKNGFREPAYHRLDLALNRHKKKIWGERTWSFGVYNAYNHLNPFFLYFGYESNERVLKQVSLFPIIPSVSYSFRF